MECHIAAVSLLHPIIQLCKTVRCCNPRNFQQITKSMDILAMLTAVWIAMAIPAKDKDVERMARKFKLDDPVTSRLTELKVWRKRNGEEDPGVLPVNHDGP